MNDKEKIYMLLNDTSINTENYDPVDLSNTEQDALFYRLKKQTALRKKPKLFKKSIGWIVASAVLLLMLFSQTGVGKTVQAATSSLLQDLRYSISRALGHKESVSPDTTVTFNQTALFGDTEVKVEDLLLFDHKLILNILIDSALPIEEELITGFENFSIFVNGNEIDTGQWVGTGEWINAEENVQSKLYTLDGIEEIQLSDEITIQIEAENLSVAKNSPDIEDISSMSTIEGKATYQIKTSKTELTKHTQKYDIFQEVSTKDYDYTVTSLYTHPIYSFINVHTQDWIEDYQLLELRGVNEQGQTIIFTPYTYTQSQNDSNTTFAFSEERSDLTSEQLSNAEFLELQFYSAGHPEGTEATYLPYGDPIMIDLIN